MVKYAIAILLAALFFIAVMVIDNHRFVVRRYHVRSRAVKRPVRIVFIADLHEKDYGNGNEGPAEAIAEQRPDLILIGGDLIISSKVWRDSRKNAGDAAGETPGADTEQKYAESGPASLRSAGWMKNSAALIKRLAPICPVWFVRGNHEIRLTYYEELKEYDALFRKEMESAGVSFIENRCEDPFSGSAGYEDSGIRIQGLELPMRYYEKFKKTGLSSEELERLIGKPDPSFFTILLTHTPVYFEEYVRWGADLSLCGHVHGGLMRLPFIGGVMGTRPNLFPKYSGGQYFYDMEGRAKSPRGDRGSDSGKRGTMVVTCGLGMHTLPIRIFNPGEISVIELEPEDAPCTERS